MSPFNFCLSAAKNLSSFQLLPASLIPDLLQLFLGLPLFLFPWGFQSSAAVGISPSSFLNVWPIHLNFLFLISIFISSCPVTYHMSLLEIIFGHHILNPYTPNDHYSGRTAPLTSKRCTLYIYSTNIGTEYFEHGIYSPFFPLQNAVCFIIITYLVLVLFTFYLQDVLN